MFEIKLYDFDNQNLPPLTYAIIVARYKDKWVFCKHKQRDTWELPGGHIESGENYLEAAKRELFEETGAVSFDIKPVFVYSISKFGILCFAEIKEFDKLPNFEIEKIDFFKHLPSSLTYPVPHTQMFNAINSFLNNETPSTYKFSKAKLEDIDELLLLYKEVTQKTFTTWGENYPSKDLLISDIKNKNLYILKLNNKIIASSFLGKKENDSETWNIPFINAYNISRICVSPSYQRQGIGKIFMLFLINKAISQGADGMHFHVCTKNLAAMKMYESVGFKNYGLGQSNYGFEFYKYEQQLKN